MRIMSFSANNFGSYSKLDFNLDNQGLCLIMGNTGSGKSTILDLAPWTLYGFTAKEGSVDEVVTWNKDNTNANIEVEIKGKTIRVYRSRKPNDLYYTHSDSLHEVKHRGKDLSDTQKQINEHLGIDVNTYVSGAYLHEFSKTAQFFNTTAKIRRSITEQLVDLSKVTKLQEKIASEKKNLKTSLITKESDLRILKERNNLLEGQLIQNRENHANFDQAKEEKLILAAESHEKFELNKKNTIKSIKSQIVDLTKEQDEIAVLKSKIQDKNCNHCGASLDNQAIVNILKRENKLAIQSHNNKLKKQELQRLINQPNPYDKLIDELVNLVNTYDKDIEKIQADLQKTKNPIIRTDFEVFEIKTKLADLDMLSEVVETYRSNQITTTIDFIQDKTNDLLSTYFDAEIKVIFSAEDADKLEAEIYKDGNLCSYTQLSKGQRQLLKLTFGIAVMYAITNKSGVTLNCIFLDEVLSGLDDLLKIKSYRLLENLALDFNSVFFIDHSNEIKSIANNKYLVQINNGESSIEKI